MKLREILAVKINSAVCTHCYTMQPYPSLSSRQNWTQL